MRARPHRRFAWLALLLAPALAVSSSAEEPAGPTLAERSTPEVKTDLARCRPVTLTATAALSLKSPTPKRLAHLVEGATLTVREGGVAARLLELQPRPARVSYGAKEQVGVRVDCRVELVAPTDSPARSYSVVVTLPRADDLSYWGGYLTPRFTFGGRLLRPTTGAVCPRSSLPAPAAARPAAPQARPGVVRESWTMIRWLTRGEALAAGLVLPVVAVASYKICDHVNPILRLILFLFSLLAGLCALFAWVRVLFVWS